MLQLSGSEERSRLQLPLLLLPTWQRDGGYLTTHAIATISSIAGYSTNQQGVAECDRLIGLDMADC